MVAAGGWVVVIPGSPLRPAGRADAGTDRERSKAYASGGPKQMAHGPRGSGALRAALAGGAGQGGGFQAGEDLAVEFGVRLPGLDGDDLAVAHSLFGAVGAAVRLDLVAHVLVAGEAVAL